MWLTRSTSAISKNIWFKLLACDASKGTLHGHRLFAVVLERFDVHIVYKSGDSISDLFFFYIHCMMTVPQLL